MRIRIGQGFWATRLGLVVLGAVLLLLLTTTGITTYYWISYGRMIDLRLSGHIQQTTARIYSDPMRISAGQPLTVAELANHLERGGYSQLDVHGTPGRYVLHASEIEIRPSAESYFNGKNRLLVTFSGKSVQKIRLLDTGAPCHARQSIGGAALRIKILLPHHLTQPRLFGLPRPLTSNSFLLKLAVACPNR